jgi:hypothetical protein
MGAVNLSGLTKMVQARYPDTKKAGMADGKEDSDVHVKKIPIESALSRNISRKEHFHVIAKRTQRQPRGRTLGSTYV